MKPRHLIIFFVISSMIFAAVGLSYSPAAAQVERPEIDRNTFYVPGEVLVTMSPKLADYSYRISAEAVARNVGAAVAELDNNTALLSFAEDADIEDMLQRASAVSGVIRAQPNYIYWIPEDNPKDDLVVVHGITVQTQDGQKRTISADALKNMRSVRKVGGINQSVPSFPSDWYYQWGNEYIDWDLIWPDKKASPTVCVIDTGVDQKHPDFKKGTSHVVVNGWDFVNEDGIPNDDNGHGTHVAGTIAAVTNNGIGVAGISNGKVLAVKVLNSQGYGTSFDIWQGIRYCANNPAVKVLNMSLGGYYPGGLEYEALNYAINTKGKLVAVAAGNGSTSGFHYPAAWAGSYICRNGSSTGDPAVPCDTAYSPANANTIHQGLISVGAARSYSSSNFDTNGDGYLWVDVDGNTLEITDDTDPAFWDEHFDFRDCAAYFSNYGAWVNVVAPGQSIYSTVPVNYPYYENYFHGVDYYGDGYASFSGTSMATPHVAAAAARVWGTYPVLTAALLKNKIMTESQTSPMVFAMDPNMINPGRGYYDDGYAGEAPFCWPDDTYGSLYAMSGTRYLNIASLMNRGALIGQLFDANTGTPLLGATVSAYQATSLKDRSKIVSKEDPYYLLINVPAGVWTRIVVNRTGYTNGSAQIANVYTIPDAYVWWDIATTAIPPMTNRISAVAAWETFDWGSNWNTDLDMVTFLPEDVDTIPWWSFEGGELSAYPRMYYNREGGWTDPMGLESLTIMPRTGFPTMPFYNTNASRHYDFFLYEWEPGGLNTYGVLMRLWRGGRIIGQTEKSVYCDSDGADDTYGYWDPSDPAYADDEVFWKFGSMNLGTFTPADQCSIDATSAGGGLLPYSFARPDVKPIQ